MNRKDDWITQLHIQEELNKKDFYILDGEKVMTKSYQDIENMNQKHKKEIQLLNNDL